jgi:hypothetical protein
VGALFLRRGGLHGKFAMISWRRLQGISLRSRLTEIAEKLLPKSVTPL